MADWKSHIVCLLCMFTCISLSESFNVDELCAKRCLYGRGGVLCNCNAMHFNGKRSESSHSQVNNLRGYNWHNHHVQLPHNDRRLSLTPNNFIYYSSPNSHDVQPLEKKDLNINSGVLVDSWDHQGGRKMVHNFGQKFDVERVKEQSRYANDVIGRKENSLIPIEFLNESEKENNSDNSEDDFVNTRREVASTIKQIMAAPLMASEDRVSSVNFKDEFLDDVSDHHDDDNDKDDDNDVNDDGDNKNRNDNNNVDGAAEDARWSQNLIHLQKVMRHVRHIR